MTYHVVQKDVLHFVELSDRRQPTVKKKYVVFGTMINKENVPGSCFFRLYKDTDISQIRIKQELSFSVSDFLGAELIKKEEREEGILKKRTRDIHWLEIFVKKNSPYSQNAFSYYDEHYGFIVFEANDTASLGRLKEWEKKIKKNLNFRGKWSMKLSKECQRTIPTNCKNHVSLYLTIHSLSVMVKDSEETSKCLVSWEMKNIRKITGKYSDFDIMVKEKTYHATYKFDYANAETVATEINKVQIEYSQQHPPVKDNMLPHNNSGSLDRYVQVPTNPDNCSLYASACNPIQNEYDIPSVIMRPPPPCNPEPIHVAAPGPSSVRPSKLSLSPVPPARPPKSPLTPINDNRERKNSAQEDQCTHPSKCAKCSKPLVPEEPTRTCKPLPDLPPSQPISKPLPKLPPREPHRPLPPPPVEPHSSLDPTKRPLPDRPRRPLPTPRRRIVPGTSVPPIDPNDEDSHDFGIPVSHVQQYTFKRSMSEMNLLNVYEDNTGDYRQSKLIKTGSVDNLDRLSDNFEINSCKNQLLNRQEVDPDYVTNHTRKNIRHSRNERQMLQNKKVLTEVIKCWKPKKYSSMKEIPTRSPVNDVHLYPTLPRAAEIQAGLPQITEDPLPDDADPYKFWTVEFTLHRVMQSKTPVPDTMQLTKRQRILLGMQLYTSVNGTEVWQQLADKIGVEDEKIALIETFVRNHSKTCTAGEIVLRHWQYLHNKDINCLHPSDKRTLKLLLNDIGSGTLSIVQDICQEGECS